MGIVHPSNASVSPAVATYSIDNDTATELPLPAASRNIPNQEFFQSQQLNQGQHNLLINVTSEGSPYTLDYLIICGGNLHFAPIAPAVTGAHNQISQSSSSNKLAAVVGAILGTMLLIILVGLVLILLKITRRGTSSKATTGPLRDWLQRRKSFLGTQRFRHLSSS